MQAAGDPLRPAAAGASVSERLLRRLIHAPPAPCPSCLRRGPRPVRADAAARTLAALLEPDPPLARRLMAVARPHGARSNLADAIGRLGTQRARLLVDALCWRERLVSAEAPAGSVGAAAGDPALAGLWRHSVACGHAALALAQVTGRVAPDDAWRMGLLHDIGARFALEQRPAGIGPAVDAPADAARLVAAEPSAPTCVASTGGERARAEARLRAWLALRTLRGWELPPDVALAIARHDHAGRCEENPTVALLRTAHGIADALGHAWGAALGDTVDLDGARRCLDLSESTIDRIRVAVQPRVDAMLADLSLAR